MSLTLLSFLIFMAPQPDDAFLRTYAESRGFLAGRPTAAVVTPNGKMALFLRSGPRDAVQDLLALEFATGVVRTLASTETILGGNAEALSPEESARRERMRTKSGGITAFSLSPDGLKALVSLAGQLYVVGVDDSRVRLLPTSPGACVDPSFSPDGTQVAFVRDDDLFTISLATGVERRITSGGSEDVSFGTAEFVAQEEMGRFRGYWFSSDSSAIAYQRTDNRNVERLTVADPLHPDAVAPRPHYPRAGKANAVVSLWVQPMSGGAAHEIRWDAVAFPYLATVTWKGPELLLVVQNRAQTEEHVLAADPRGVTRVLHTETDAAWLNLDQNFPFALPDGRFFWLTERNGAPEVELRDAQGARTWVALDAGFGDFAGYDAATKILFFIGGPNPTSSQLYRVGDAAPPTEVKLPGSVVNARLCDGAPFVVATVATSTSMPRTIVLRPDGALLATLPSVAIEPTLAFHVETRHLGKSDLYAQLFVPSRAPRSTKLAVVLDVYGGPRHQHVVEEPALLSQWLASQGFAVVRIDGKGTPRRGRAFERAIRGDFATAAAQSQLDGLAELAASNPRLDLTRVGAVGWSFGGYLAGVLALSYPGQVKAAVLGAPVSDWTDYDTHYTERYLGVPTTNAAAYARSGLLSRVTSGASPTLIFHGTADDNVLLVHTLKLSDALFRAGAPHQVIPLLNYTHMVKDPEVTMRMWQRIARFFADTL